jgi:hypothetical protein
MMNIVRQWLVSLNEAERSLRSQGYIVVYGGMTSVVVPISSSGEPPRQRARPILALRCSSDCPWTMTTLKPL